MMKMLQCLYEKISARGIRLGDDASLVADLQVALKRYGALSLLALAFLLPSSASAAISYDTTTDISANSGSGVNITVAADDTVLLVHGIDNSTNALTAATATVGGVAMTQIGVINIGDNDQFAFCLANPASGTKSVVITETGGTAHLSRATLYKGTNVNCASLNKAQSHQTTNLTTSLTVSANSWLVSMIRNSGANVSAGTGTTIRTPSTNNIFTADSNAALSAGSQSLVFTNGNSGTWEYTTIELPAAATASTDNGLLGLVNAFWIN